MFVVVAYFVINSVRKLLDTHSYCRDPDYMKFFLHASYLLSWRCAAYLYGLHFPLPILSNIHQSVLISLY